MKTIHKHRIAPDALTVIELPESAVVRFVEYVVPERAVNIWVEVDAESFLDCPKVSREFHLFSTGQGVPNGAEYIGSTIDQYEPEAYHLYEMHQA